MGTTRGESSKQSCDKIKSNEEGAKYLAVTFESQLNSAVFQQQEDEKKIIRAQLKESSKLRENYKNVEEEITKELKGFKLTFENFTDKDLKKVIIVDKIGSLPVKDLEIPSLHFALITHR